VPDSMVRGLSHLFRRRVIHNSRFLKRLCGDGRFRPSRERSEPAGVPDRKFFDIKILLTSDFASRACLSFSRNSMIPIGLAERRLSQRRVPFSGNFTQR
jgi:hypothetical protein